VKRRAPVDKGVRLFIFYGAMRHISVLK